MKVWRILFCLWLVPIFAVAQPFQVQFQQLQPPTPFLNDWEQIPFFRATIQNTTQQLQQFYVELQFRNNHTGEEFSTISYRMQLAPQQMITLDNTQKGAQGLIDWQATRQRNSGFSTDLTKFLLTGILPEGIYTVCARLLAADGVTEIQKVQPCLTIVIQHPPQPRIVLPQDKSYVSHQQPTFLIQWVATPPLGTRQQFRYRLRIVEMLPGQAPEQALQSGRVVFSTELVQQTQYLYTVGKDPMLTPYSTYAVEVQQGYQYKGKFIPVGQNNGRSVPVQFVYGEQLSAVTITYPQKGALLTTKQLPLTIQWQGPKLTAPLAYRLVWAPLPAQADPEGLWNYPNRRMRVVTPKQKGNRYQAALSKADFPGAGRYGLRVQIVRRLDQRVIVESRAIDFTLANLTQPLKIQLIAPRDEQNFPLNQFPVTVRWRINLASLPSQYFYRLRWVQLPREMSPSEIRRRYITPAPFEDLQWFLVSEETRSRQVGGKMQVERFPVYLIIKSKRTYTEFRYDPNTGKYLTKEGKPIPDPHFVWRTQYGDAALQKWLRSLNIAETFIQRYRQVLQNRKAVFEKTPKGWRHGEIDAGARLSAELTLEQLRKTGNYLYRVEIASRSDGRTVLASDPQFLGAAIPVITKILFPKKDPYTQRRWVDHTKFPKQFWIKWKSNFHGFARPYDFSWRVDIVELPNELLTPREVFRNLTKHNWISREETPDDSAEVQPLKGKKFIPYRWYAARIVGVWQPSGGKALEIGDTVYTRFLYGKPPVKDFVIQTPPHGSTIPLNLLPLRVRWQNRAALPKDVEYRVEWVFLSEIMGEKWLKMKREQMTREDMEELLGFFAPKNPNVKKRFVQSVGTKTEAVLPLAKTQAHYLAIRIQLYGKKLQRPFWYTPVVVVKLDLPEIMISSPGITLRDTSRLATDGQLRWQTQVERSSSLSVLHYRVTMFQRRHGEDVESAIKRAKIFQKIYSHKEVEQKPAFYDPKKHGKLKLYHSYGYKVEPLLYDSTTKQWYQYGGAPVATFFVGQPLDPVVLLKPSKSEIVPDGIVEFLWKGSHQRLKNWKEFRYVLSLVKVTGADTAKFPRTDTIRDAQKRQQVQKAKQRLAAERFYQPSKEIPIGSSALLPKWENQQDTSYTLQQAPDNDAPLLLARVEVRWKKNNQPVAWSRTVEIRWKEKLTAPEKADTIPLPIKSIAYLVLPYKDVIRQSSGKSGVKIYTTKKPVPLYIPALRFLFKGITPKIYVSFKNAWINFKTFEIVKGRIFAGVNPDQVKSNKDYKPLLKIGSFPLSIAAVEYRAYDKKDKQSKNKPNFFVTLGLQIPGWLDRPILLKNVTLSDKGLEGQFTYGTYSKTHKADEKPVLKWDVIPYGGLWFTLDGITVDFATGNAPEKWKFQLSGDIGSHLFAKVQKSTEIPKPLHYFATVSVLPKGDVKANFGLDFTHFEKDSLTKKARIPFGLFDFIPMKVGSQPPYEFTLNKGRFTFRLAGVLNFPFLGNKARITIRQCTFDSKDGITFDAGARSGQTFELFGFKWILKQVKQGEDPLSIRYDNQAKELTVTLGGIVEVLGHQVRFSGLTFSSKKGPRFSTIDLLSKPVTLVKPDWLTLRRARIYGPGKQEGKPVEFALALQYRIPFYSKQEQFQIRITTDGRIKGGHQQVLFDEPSAVGNKGDWTEISIDSLLTIDLVYFDAKLQFTHSGEKSDLSIALRSVFDLYLGAPENRLSLGKRTWQQKGSINITPGFELTFDPLNQKVDYRFGSIQGKKFPKPVPVIPKLLSVKDFQLKEGRLPSKDKDSLLIVFGGTAALEAGKAVESSLRLDDFTITNKGVQWDKFRIRAGRLNIMSVFVAEVADIQYNTKPETFTATRFVDNPKEVFKNNKGSLPTQQQQAITVEKYLTFTVKELSLNIGGTKVFQGKLKKFQYYRTKNDGVSILVQGASLRFGSKDAVSIAGDFEYTHIPQQRTAMLMAGKIAVLKKVELVAFGKVKTDFDSKGKVSKTSFGFYCAAAFGDPGLPLGGGVFIGALGGGFFYNPEQSDINLIKQLSGLADQKLAREKFQDLIKNPSINPNAGSFALLLYGGVVVGSKSLVKTRALLTLSANYFELVGAAEFLGQGENISGGLQVLVQWKPKFAMEGNAFVIAKVAKIINADGRLGFFVYPDAWAIFAALQVGVFKTPNSKAFGLDGTARFFIGSPGFLLELGVGLNADFWIVSISAGLDLSVWYFVEKSYGAYFSVWIEAKVGGGFIAKARGELMAAMVSMRQGKSWNWFVYGEASLSISVLVLVKWKGTVYALYGNTRPFQAGFGSNPHMRALIDKARGKAAKMAQQVAKIKQKVQQKVVGKLFKYDEKTLAKAFQTYWQKVEKDRKQFVQTAINKETAAFRTMTGLSGSEYVTVRSGVATREFRLLSENELRNRLNHITRTYWNPDVPAKVRNIEQTLAKSRQELSRWEQRYQSIARKVERTLGGILQQLPNAKYQEKRAATIQNPLRNVQLPTSSDPATVKRLLQAKKIGFGYDQGILQQNERSATEGEQFAKQNDPLALMRTIRQYAAFLRQIDSATAEVEQEIEESFLNARKALIRYYLDAIWTVEYADRQYGWLKAKTAVGSYVNQWFDAFDRYVQQAVAWRSDLPDPGGLRDIVTWRFQQIAQLSGDMQAFSQFQSMALKYPIAGADWSTDSVDYLWWGKEYRISGRQFWYEMPKAFYDQQQRLAQRLMTELAIYREGDLMTLERRQAAVTKQLDAIYDAQLEMVELLWDLVDYQLYLLKAYKSAGSNPYATAIQELEQLKQRLEWRLRVPRITKITAHHRQQGPNLFETFYKIEYAVPDWKSSAYHYNCCGGVISYDITNLWLGKVPTFSGWKAGYDPNWGIRTIDYIPTTWKSQGIWKAGEPLTRTVKFRVRVPGGYAFQVQAQFSVPVLDSGRYDFDNPPTREWWQAKEFENQRTETRPPEVEVYQPVPMHRGTTPQLPPSGRLVQSVTSLQGEWRSGRSIVYRNIDDPLVVRWTHPASDVIEYKVAVLAAAATATYQTGGTQTPVLAQLGGQQRGMQRLNLPQIGGFRTAQWGSSGGSGMTIDFRGSGSQTSAPIWGWTSMGGRTSVTLRQLPLKPKGAYVIGVQVKTLGGGWSPIGYSATVAIDNTPPKAIDGSSVKVHQPSPYGGYYERLLQQWVWNQQRQSSGGGGFQPAFQPVVVPSVYLVEFPSVKNADPESGVLGVFVMVSESKEAHFPGKQWYFVDGGANARTAFVKADKQYGSGTPVYLHLCVVNKAGVPSRITTVRIQ